MDAIVPYVIPLSTQKPRTLTLVPSDPGSRYKTRQLQVQVVGKSKMIKTVLLNILDVAKDMQVPPSYIGIFMGYVIGAQAKFDQKKPERQQAFLSGEHDPKDLSKILLNFINEVLLCPNCGLPEINIIPEQKSVFGTCRACGSHAELKISDEKFKRYVLNHPPQQSKSAFGGNKAGGKKEVKDGKKDKEDKEDKIKEDKPKSNGKSKHTEEDVVWFSDTSEQAARKRREEMLPESMLIPAQDEKKTKLEQSDFEKVLKEPDVLEQLQQLKSKSEGDDKSFVTVLFNSLFGAATDLVAELKVPEKQKILNKFCCTPGTQSILLSCLENYCGKTNTAMLTKVPFVLKQCYDSELLEEDCIFQWYESETDKIPSVREQATPIIKWLKEAEEESEDEEGDEEN